ncbi:Regulator of RpoS [Paenibacillus plantiphilus]|uniref:Regulator of RpoS n=1 Tax=Paenibacillus plantiphilus TaxID=2905650 RepID=A0ABN8GCT8_9BACL|nr:response regulator transcription factor [Paenibacillus plantiphilus]CAH1200568.1 Regulator of RpoS [Paenibacillus plantiphilus]
MYKVFLVDDEPFILEGLCDAVDWSSYGLELTGHAGNGREALERLKEVPADILITDITMPLMNGLELIRSVREFRPDLKIIILSGYNEFNYLKEGMALGIENYLLKPINFTELTETLQNTVERLNAIQETRRGYTEDEISILKDNILYRWITGRISPAELAERISFLDLQLSGAYMLAVILRADDNTDESRHKEIKRRIDAMPNVISFTDIEGDIVAVVMAGSPSQCKDRAAELLTHLRQELPESAQYRISLGTAESMGEGERLSYERARRAQEYFLLIGRLDIAEYEALLPEQKDELPQIQVDWSEFGRLIIAKDTEGLFARIDQDFDQAQTQEGITPELLRGLAMEMTIRLKMELDAIKQQSEAPAEGLFKAVFGKVANASDRDALVAAVKETAVMITDSLIRDDKSPVIKQVLHHIHECYMEDMSLKSLGLQYKIHPGYLGKLFHKETNDTFTEYINKYRIEKAKALLKDTVLKIHEIAKQVGYWETGYFHKQFKKYIGISPTDYRGLL